MYKSKYFTMHEMTDSITAKLNKIDNTPNEEQTEHLKELMVVLDDIRTKWGGPIRISSGYRCPELNKKVGGSSTSAHMLGYAADFKPYTNDMDAFEKFINKWVKETDYLFDQVIFERDVMGNRWIHLGLYNSTNKQRKQIKTLVKKN